MAEQKRWTRRPENSTWGDYGADDQLGRMNELTPVKVKQGIAEVKEGRTFCLSMPLDYPGGNALNPRRHPPQVRPSLRGDKPNWHYRTEWDRPGMLDVINDDVVIMHLQYSTQWDTLAHVGALFDANGTGQARAHLLQRLSRRHRPRRTERGQGRRRPARHVRGSQGHLLGQRAGRREHGGQVPAGARRDDRPLRPLRAQAPCGRLRRSDARHGGRRHQGRGRRLRAAEDRLRRADPGGQQEARPAPARDELHRPRRRRCAPAAMGHRDRSSWR